MQPGDSLYFECPVSVANTMQQIGTDIYRAGLSELTQTHLLAVNPKDKTVIDLVQVTRRGGNV
jgi:hypothetical protein